MRHIVTSLFLGLIDFFIVTEREFFSINFPLVWVIIILE